MTSKLSTVLIIGGTSGIGEAFARRFHAAGKKVIIAGRRVDKLAVLAKELPGLATVEWDIADLSQLSQKTTSILEAYKTLDTVFINAGVQKCFSFQDPSTSTPESIISEININMTAPILLSRLFVPHLMSIAASGKPANLLLTSSALAYLPLGFYPVYAPTKAGVHAFCVVLRQQLSHAADAVKKNLSITELVPPYVDTALDKDSREATVEMQGGKEKAQPPMPLDEYMSQAWSSLERLGSEGKLPKEIGVGFGEVNVATWRESFGKTFESMGIEC